MIDFIYLTTTVLLIFGLRQMSSPKSAKKGILLAGYGMLAAIIATFFNIPLTVNINYLLIGIGILTGSVFAWYLAQKVAMIHIPQMIALFNGMGGCAASVIAIIELMHAGEFSIIALLAAICGVIIGTFSFAGSIIAFAKLQEILPSRTLLPHYRFITAALTVLMLTLLFYLILIDFTPLLLTLFILLIAVIGVVFSLPIGGANMPVVISLFNAMTGLAVGLNGFMLDNPALIIAGTVVGASGVLLTQLMAKAMNKSLWSIFFATPATKNMSATESASGEMKPIEIHDAAIMLSYAKLVIIVPGYGIAVAQAQYKVWELAQLLEKNGVIVKFAIHPVAGRMPGHMNVLLAEAGVPYDKICDLDAINAEFSHADVALVIGANDVVNPAAHLQTNSPIYGMPILNATEARNVLVIKRGEGKGFSGIENALFTADNTHMLFGGGQEVLSGLIQALKAQFSFL